MSLDLVERALRKEKFAISQLISLYEDRRSSASGARAEVQRALEAREAAPVIGITGTPGSGKSTLLSKLTRELLASSQRSLAVVAVDPSSQASGGALLGDRTRMEIDREEPRLFFRSQASANELGGLGPRTHDVCELLIRLFDCVFVETVGIGQNEAEIRTLADRTLLVLQPLGGDEVQFLKSGIMELPDAYVLNKCDVPAAERSYHQLRASLWLARPEQPDLPILRTSARTGAGLPELCARVQGWLDHRPRIDAKARTALLFQRWVREEWGRQGLARLEQLGGAEALLRREQTLEAARASLARAMPERAKCDGFDENEGGGFR